MVDKTPTFKLLFIGDSSVGKTSILRRFLDDDFDDSETCTIGVDFNTKKYEVDGINVNLNIWDTAGQEKFRSLTCSYYRGAQGVILVYDISNLATFEHIEMWLSEVDMYSSDSNVVKLLVGNKVDLEEKREVELERATSFARSKSMMFMECSAKTRKGIQHAFEELVRKILETPSLYDYRLRDDRVDVGGSGNSADSQSGWCC